MAIIGNFFNMTENQRLDFYDKIKDNNKLVDNDLKDTLEEIDIKQYNQLRAEVANYESYLEIFEANVDIEKTLKFIEENKIEQENLINNKENIDQDERVRFLEAIQKISDTEKSYATFEGIKTQNEELKISLLKESEKFVDTKDVLNKYTSPIKESINDKSLNDSVGMKIKLISLEHNTNLYNNYSNHATSLLNTLEKTMASQQKLTRTDFSNLKAHFFSNKNEEKISLKDYIKIDEEEGEKVKDIFYNLERGENVNNNLNELKSFLTEKKDGLIETTNSLKDYNEDIKKSLAENNITPEFMMKMWKQGKDGKWIQEEIDLFKELNLKDEKALQQRIEEIQSANKLHMNTNTTGITAASIQQAMDKTFNGNTADGRTNGLGFFNYTVFPYTLMIDLGAAGLNFYSFGKNITQDIKDRKEKNEILKSVSDELSTFDINNLVNKTDNKAILELNEKAKKEGKDLSTIINDYTNEDFEKKLKELNINEEEINKIKENRTVIGEKLGFLTKYQESNNFIALDLKAQTNVLESFKNGLEKLENSNYDLSKIEDEEIVIKHTKTFLEDLKVQNEKYENIEITYKQQLKDIDDKIENLKIKEKDSNLNQILNFGSLEINNLIEAKKTIEQNLKTIENNKMLFKDVLSKDFLLEDRLKNLQYTKLISEENGKENLDNVFTFTPETEKSLKDYNDNTLKLKAMELNPETPKVIGKVDGLNKSITKGIFNNENSEKFEEVAKNISERTGKQISSLDVASTFLANKGKETPLFKHASKQINDSIEAFKTEMKTAGKEPTLKAFIDRYGLMEPIDIDSIFKEQFEAFLTNYDEMQKAAKELGLENSMLFKAGQSKEIGAFREKILGFDKALSENLEKSDYSHIVPKKFQDLITDAKESEKFLKVVEEKGAKAFDDLQINQQQKENLNKIDETIEKNRKIELDKKLEEDKKLKLEEDKKDREKKESEGMSFGGR